MGRFLLGLALGVLGHKAYNDNKEAVDAKVAELKAKVCKCKNTEEQPLHVTGSEEPITEQ